MTLIGHMGSNLKTNNMKSLFIFTMSMFSIVLAFAYLTLKFPPTEKQYDYRINIINDKVLLYNNNDKLIITTTLDSLTQTIINDNL